jgi:hypothetical protein
MSETPGQRVKPSCPTSGRAAIAALAAGWTIRYEQDRFSAALVCVADQPF